MNDNTYKTLEQAAETLKRLSQGRHIPYNQRAQLARGVREVQELARLARQKYVNWLWGY